MRRLALAFACLLPLYAGDLAAEPVDPGTLTDGCGTRAAVARWLAERFAEHPFARGLQGDGLLFELYANDTGATWTVVVTDTEGMSCVVGEGTSLEVLPSGAKGPVA